ncbi:MAG TPA: Ig-like domain-containing protein [Acidimicrobiales bacterium]|nr:Ig-like domain-containing protein [Acidimicrobiales bacterium]
MNDEVYGNVDGVDTNVDGNAEFPAFFDAPDATLNVPISLLTWEQVSGAGDHGSLVYVLENKGPTSVTEPTVVPYYRDDACLDDGTGDNPVPRPFPGEASSDPRVKAAYAAHAGKPYDQLACTDRQGAFGSHGVHFFVTGDTDNAFLPSPVPVNEVDAQQWQFVVPTAAPTNVGHRYSMEVRTPLVAVATQQPSEPMTQTSLSLTAPASVQLTDEFDVVVDLARAPSGSRVEVSFADQSRTVTVDGDGRGVATFVASGATGRRSVTASYAGDARYTGSTAETVVDAVREASVLELVISGRRPSATLTARLVDDDGAAVTGAAVEFLVNDRIVATRITAVSGVASATVRLKRGDAVGVRYGGDETYLPSSATGTAP